MMLFVATIECSMGRTKGGNEEFGHVESFRRLGNRTGISVDSHG
jgi:hypothetical protein